MISAMQFVIMNIFLAVLGVISGAAWLGAGEWWGAVLCGVYVTGILFLAWQLRLWSKTR